MNKRQASAIAAAVVVAAAAGGGLVIASVGKSGSSNASAATSSSGMPAFTGQAGAGGPPGGAMGQGRGPGGPGGGLDAAATYLGVSVSTLRTDLSSGKTLAQVAQSTTGKTVDGLIAALVAAETTRLDSAVSAGSLTAAQETTLLAGLRSHVTAMVNGTGGPGAGGGPPPGFGGTGGTGSTSSTGTIG
jgi:hypothetical protein